MTDIIYASEQNLSIDEYVDVVGHSTLGPTRPLANRARVARMLSGANVVVSARVDGRCIGVARGMTDFAWVCYLGDLAVHQDFQGRGIGTALLRKVQEVVGEEVGVALLSMPEAVGYYDRLGGKIGLKRYPHTYWLDRTSSI